MNKIIVALLVFIPMTSFVFAVDGVNSTGKPAMTCDVGVRSGDECIDLYECSSYSDGCNTCTVSEDGELSSCTERECLREGIPQCEQFRKPTHLGLNFMQTNQYDTTWKLVQGKLGLLSEFIQQEIYTSLVSVLSDKVQEMNYTKMISKFTQEGLISFNIRLDAYRYFLYKARLELRL